MKKQFVIAFIVIALTLIIAFIGAAGSQGRDYALSYGITCCAFGLIWVFVGVLFVAPRNTRAIGHGFLIAAGITFLIGTGVCSTMLS